MGVSPFRIGQVQAGEAGQKVLRELPLEGWAAQRRQDLLKLLSGLNPQITQLDQAVERAAHEHPRACLLMTQPGIGPITTLAYVITMGDVTRFQRGKQVASYLGLIPSERSSSNRRRLGSISKQGSPFLRMLLVESVQTTSRRASGPPAYAEGWSLWHPDNLALTRVRTAIVREPER